MSWFQIWTMCWQIAIVVTPMILALCALWLRSQFVTKVDFAVARSGDAADRVAIAADIKALDKLTAGHANRLNVVEKDLAEPPSRHTLNNDLSRLQASIHSVGKSLDAAKHQAETQAADSRRSMETMNAYLHTLIEKHLGA